MKIGEVAKINWYELEDGRVVSFHTLFDQWPDNEDGQKPTIIYSDKDTWPSITALKLGLEYAFMRNSDAIEVATFLLQNEDIKIKKVIEV